MLPPVLVHHPHVEAPKDRSPLVRGSNVPVRRIWYWHQKGIPAETLVKRYPSLGMAKILDALSFGYDNQELMAADRLREQSEYGSTDALASVKVSE